ncbi:basic proline-rich protein-like [Acinonyx jubatus]|uniref:Basic proline-rich protein-like n=1 Tax=Acinonyx jubatus TaxID=32536 RepID=A0ABM3N9X5_ACIJB|nr:basic proline-rich protein-like [Acinonyx jubatus]
MNDAHNLGVRAPAPEEKQTPSSPPSFAGVLRRPGLGKDGVWVSEAPNPGPAGSASIKLLREVCSRFQAGASPGQGRGPRHLLGAKALRPRPLPGPPPPPRVAHTAGARVIGWCPGGLASPPQPPRPSAAAGPAPRATAPGPLLGPGTIPPGTPREGFPRGQRFPSEGGVSGHPASRSPTPTGGPVPAQPRTAPSARGRERAPGQAVRCCARAEAPARSPAAPSLTVRALRHIWRRRRLRCLLLAARHPGPVPTPQAPARALGDPAPGGLGGHPHAGHAPRGRARAPGSREGVGPSWPRAWRQPWINKGHAHCLSLPGVLFLGDW